eukprot:scaffold51378_cov28-Tisochrysis_lutea.AAC.1
MTVQLRARIMPTLLLGGSTTQHKERAIPPPPSLINLFVGMAFQNYRLLQNPLKRSHQFGRITADTRIE